MRRRVLVGLSLKPNFVAQSLANPQRRRKEISLEQTAC
jgi:hypothetical protein